MLTLLLLSLAQPPALAPAADDLYPPADPTVKLPQPESLLRANLRSFAVRPAGGGFTLVAGTVPLREFGADRQTADDALRAVQGLLKLTDWGTVPGKVPLDYALADGRAAPAHPQYRHLGARTIDLRSIRAEGVRGTWVLRDDFGILTNFGPDPAPAEQAAAVCRRYGFNRLLAVGGADRPALRLLFAAQLSSDGKELKADPFAATFQNQTLDRSGVPVPGGGYAGERLTFDPRKLEVRKDRADWVLALGREVLARFGGDDTAAREAARMAVDNQLTEYCTVGGLTFFLSHGKPQTRVPFTARSVPFAADQLQATPQDGRWAVTAGGRAIAAAASEAEAKQMLGVIKAFRFDTACQLGAKGGLRFLARTGGR